MIWCLILLRCLESWDWCSMSRSWNILIPDAIRLDQLCRQWTTCNKTDINMPHASTVLAGEEKYHFTWFWHQDQESWSSWVKNNLIFQVYCKICHSSANHGKILQETVCHISPCLNLLNLQISKPLVGKNQQFLTLRRSKIAFT